MQGLLRRLLPSLRPVSPVPRRATSPWLERQIGCLTWLIDGFDDYARAQPVVNYFDLMCWSILCCAFDVAQVLWKVRRPPKVEFG